MHVPVIRSRSRQRRTLAVAVIGLTLLVGCSRQHYRQQADEEVYSLVECASTDSRWPVDDFTIQPDMRSRMYDPNCPDSPPMPPDDPSSHRFMECVDGKAGWPLWNLNGHTPYVENPDWMAYLPLNEDGRVVLDRDGAVEMALLQSRAYQSALENLYLSALDVTFQRFRFDAQFLGGNSTFYDANGSLRPQDRLNTDTNFGVSKLNAIGGELVAGVANSLVWQFGTGPNSPYRGTTLLDFTLLQPLLRTGGRAVVLDRLTDAERALLSNIRQMERFRRGFYTQITVGGGGITAPRRSGQGIASSGGLGLLSTSGFLGLLETQVRIRNQQSNVADLEESLNRLRSLFEAGRLGDAIQVEQARQSLVSSQSQLLSQQTGYDTQLDGYKITLGLPPSLDVSIEDTLLDRFTLIDQTLTEMRLETTDLLNAIQAPDTEIPADYRDRLIAILADTLAEVRVVEQDVLNLEESAPTRIRNLEMLANRPAVKAGEVDPVICDVDEFLKRVEELKAESPVVSEALRTTVSSIEKLLADQRSIDDPESIRQELKVAVDTLSDKLMDLTLVQAKSRLDTVSLIPIELSWERAFQVAAENRRDWMNARSALVDQWRQIEVAANALMSDVDLVFSGDVGTSPSNNPLKFNSQTGQLSVGIRFDAPLNRIAQRNTYRETLIQYQQTKRTYYALEDLVEASLRRTLREIQLSQLDFELRRLGVYVAIIKVDQASINLDTPPRPGQRLSENLSRNVTDALRDLLNAQNTFLGVWVDYQAQRMTLDLDMGIMQLDARGMWIDPGPVMEDEMFTGAMGDLGDDVGQPIPAPLLPPSGEVPAPNVEL